MYFDNYKLGAKVGSGGFGTVFVAKCKKKRIAVKVFKHSNARREQAMYKEFQKVKPSCPHIPQWFGMRQSNRGSLMMGLEYLDTDLRKYSASNPLGEPMIFEIFRQLLAALRSVHGCQFVYRDLKPHNVMLNLSDVDSSGVLVGNVRLVDFGISKRYIVKSRHVSLKRGGFSGTLKFASMNAHNRMTQSRRDDMESLFYTIEYLLNGNSLPWDKISDTNKRVRSTKIKQQKKIFDFRSSNSLLAEFGRHAKNLCFFEEPCYDWGQGVSTTA